MTPNTAPTEAIPPLPESLQAVARVIRDDVRPEFHVEWLRVPGADGTLLYRGDHVAEMLAADRTIRAGDAAAPAQAVVLEALRIAEEAKSHLAQAIEDTKQGFDVLTRNSQWAMCRETIDRLAALVQPPEAPAAVEVSRLDKRVEESRQHQSKEGTQSELWRIGLLEWGVSGWRAEVQNRPAINVHRNRLDDFWRTVIRKAGGDPDAIIGPKEPEVAQVPSEAARLVGGEADRRLKNLQTWLVCREVGNALAPSLETVQGWLAALGDITGEAPPDFVMKAPKRDNSRCKFAAGGACCSSHCGDPACLARAQAAPTDAPGEQSRA